MPKERRVRPANSPKSQSAHSGRKASQPDSTTRDGRDEWRSPYPLSKGMTAKEIAQTFAVCLVAVIVGMLLLDALGWLVGHFVKGWW